MALTDQQLRDLVRERQGAANIRDELQKQIDEIGVTLRVECDHRGTRRLEAGEWVVLLVAQDRKTLNKTKLLSAGVSVPQIEAATETTHVEQLRVMPKGQEGG